MSAVRSLCVSAMFRLGRMEMAMEIMAMAMEIMAMRITKK
jgi:hypothetical protein